MQILDLQQGSDQWIAARGQYDCASEAPAMMAASSKLSRNDLLRMKATGQSKEFSDYVQRYVLDRGHAAEAAIRSHIESLLGEDLYPVTGVKGDLLASFDGLTMAADTVFEHKLWNETLAASVRAGKLDPEYYWQLEQQLFVSGAERAIFVVSDGTPEKCVHMFYTPVPGRAKQLADGWAQFKLDVAAYEQPVAAAVIEQTAIKALPALSVVLVGEVKSSNLVLYKSTALDFISNINTDLQTDQDFADAENMVKFCERAESELKLVKQQALGQTQTIDELFRTVDELSEQMRQKRLTLDKLVKSRKDSIRLEIAQAATKKFEAHVATINARLGKVSLPAITANFANVMKGKKTIAGVRGAVDDELARVKIEANAIGEKIDGNLRSLRELASEHAFLFADAQTLVQKEPDDLVAVIENRISAHKSAEQAKADKIAADARQKLLDEQAAEALRNAAKEVPAPANVAQPSSGQAPHALGAVLGEVLAQQERTLPRIGASPTSTAAQIREVPVSRPTDLAIINVVCEAFNVPQRIAIEWLRSMNLQSMVAA